MAAQSVDAQDFSVAGEVVEIFEQDGTRRARVVLWRPTVIDVAAARLGDVRLGDQVVVDGWIRVDAVRARAGAARPGETP